MTKWVLRLGGLALTTGLVACASDPDGTWLLDDVTVIDVAEGVSIPDRAILIRDGRIIAVTPTGSRPPRGTRSVDGQGRVVIPGLFDMHAHMVGVMPEPAPLDPSRYLRSGVLGLRDLGSPVDSILAFQSRSHSVLSPHVWFTGPILDSLPRDFAHLFLPITAPDEAKDAVRLVAERGWVSVKVSDWLSLGLYQALSAEARERGVRLAGHIPHAVPLQAVLDAGQHSIEHLGGLTHGILRACSNNAAPALESLSGPTDTERFSAVMSSDYVSPLLDGFDAGRCRLVARQLAAADVWQVPNLTLWRFWAEHTPALFDSAENRAAFRRLHRTYSEIVALMAEEGVMILTGTDEEASVHDEMQLLVAAGLSPAEALRASTVHPAEFLGAADSLGTISVGRLANLLILEADPLEDIRNTARIHSIVLRGQLFDVMDGELIRR